MNLNLTLRQVLIVFAVVLTIIFTMAFLAYNRLVKLVESDETISRNNDYVLKLEEVISYLKDAETGARGYLLTSDMVFLEPQKSAGLKVMGGLVELRHNTKMEPAQIPYIESIQRMAQKKIDITWELVHSIKSGEVKIMSEHQKELIWEGKLIMDTIRTSVQNLKVIEQKRLNINKEAQAEFARTSPRYLLTIIIMAIAIIIVTMGVIYNQLNKLNKTQKKLEEKINELAIANRELDQYAFTLTHHLQEPLRKIRLFSSRFEAKFKKNTDTDVGEEVKMIQKINTFAADSQYLLDEFLSFARLNHFEKKNIEIGDLSIIIKEVWRIKKELVNQTRAEYHIEGDAFISGYKEKLIILFEQLIDNSLKFSQTDKPLVIKIMCKEEFVDEKPCQVIIFSDNGIGFAQEYAQKVFNIFYRLNDKKNYNGLGVGLAICRKIVELHEGQISVESSPNIGTTFTIKLPFKINNII